MNIKDIKKDSVGVWLTAKITDLSPIREFEKFGKINYVAHAIIEDKTGKIKLTLWDEQIHQFKKGDRVTVDRGYVREFQGELQLNSKKITKASEADLMTQEDVDKKYNFKEIKK